MYEKILVPVDGSAPSMLGLREAIRLASRHGGRLHFLHVVDELPALIPPEGNAGSDLLFEQLRGAGQAVLATAEAEARDAGVRADSHLIEECGGQAGLRILEEANSWGADLIVCGTHGRHGLGRFVMGSDAEYVLRRSSVPVLLVPAHLQQRAPVHVDTAA
jgi:nucleotide-binding universal stress UspA family protein